MRNAWVRYAIGSSLDKPISNSSFLVFRRNTIENLKGGANEHVDKPCERRNACWT
jgi:hypothetical protein